MLSHCNNQRNLGLNGLFDCFPGMLSCHKDGCSVRIQLFFGDSHIREYWKAEMFPVLAWSDSSNDVCAIGEGLFGVGGCNSTCETLVYDSSMFANS